MSDATTDPNRLTVEVMTLGRTLGDKAGNAVANEAQITAESADGYRAMVDLADDNIDQARAHYASDPLDAGLAQQFGSDFVDGYNQAFFDGYIERVRRRLDDLG